MNKNEFIDAVAFIGFGSFASVSREAITKKF